MKKALLSLGLAIFGGVMSSQVVAHESHNHKHDIKSLVIEVVQLDPVNGNKDVGRIYVTESKYGLVFTPELHDLTVGLHGFHIHQNPSCEPKEKEGKLVAGLGAGGHWDPKNTKQHGYPWSDDAHLGDLPALYVDNEGNSTNPVLAPRLKSLNEIKGHSIMIHAGGDNHSDHPAPLGGGGPRMACGVIK
ncbi:Cu-Zn family superoxide dismutase [Bisgaardia hudsonensis]|uniref:Superoxide dismutase [Cu-Zn] n=1 Tax=Bisgaardia hudsonensis TaxID=109472 RepID=A0A4R2N1A3_9PAST|nr:superoxide dismutase family protein [Bisgaardia hudsonensis]QLB13133.1 superoxide dismutase [Bisgaardia hudsonensis]TCP13296.1 Cu-Zn family superoxide dismutase [Bisgaardia hudsonensis]